MNPGRFYLPRTGIGMGPLMSANYLPTRGGVGLFGRIAGSLRSFNWSGLLNGANKTLNVVNQTIPLVRQAGPMLNNMRSMLRVAKLFGNETTSGARRTHVDNTNERSNNNTNNNVNLSKNEKTIAKKEEVDNNYPNFFV